MTSLPTNLSDKMTDEVSEPFLIEAFERFSVSLSKTHRTRVCSRKDPSQVRLVRR